MLRVYAKAAGLLLCLSLMNLAWGEDWVFQRSARELPASGAGGQLEPGAETWLHVQAEGEGRLLFQLSAPAESDLDLEVFSGAGAVLAQSLRLDSDERALVDSLQARHFLARLVNRGDGPASYGLKADFYPGFAALAFGEEHQAALGSGHRRDVFRCPLLRGQWLLELDGEAFESSLELEVFSADGRLLGASRRDGNEQQVELACGQFREVFVHVSLRGEPVGTRYSLRLEGPRALPRLEWGRTDLKGRQSFAGWLLLAPGKAAACAVRAADGAEFELRFGDAGGSLTALARDGQAALLYAGRAETVYVELHSEQARNWQLQLAQPEPGEALQDGVGQRQQGPCLVPYSSEAAGLLEITAERGQLSLFNAEGKLVSQGRSQLLAPVAAAPYRLLLWPTGTPVDLLSTRDAHIPARRLGAGDLLAGRAGDGQLYRFEADREEVWDLRLQALEQGGRLGMLLVASDGSLRQATPASTARLSVNAEPGVRYLLQVVAAGGAAGAAYAGLAEVFACTLPARSPADAEARWGVFVGVADYAQLDDLEFCAFDALDLARQQIQQGGVASERAICLVDERATLAGLRRLLKDLRGRLGSAAQCQLFFSGHGALLADTDGDEPDGYDEALCLWEADGQAGTLSDDALAKLLEHVQGQQVVYLDACFAGGFHRDLAGRADRFALFSSQEDRLSREGIDFQGGVLSHLLLQGLSGAADADDDALVSAVELEDFILRRMPLSCPSCEALARPEDRACARCRRPFVGDNRLQHAVSLRYLDHDLILSRP